MAGRGSVALPAAFAPGRRPTPMGTFPPPALRTRRADLRHRALPVESCGSHRPGRTRPSSSGGPGAANAAPGGGVEGSGRGTWSRGRSALETQGTETGAEGALAPAPIRGRTPDGRIRCSTRGATSRASSSRLVRANSRHAALDADRRNGDPAQTVDRRRGARDGDADGLDLPSLRALSMSGRPQDRAQSRPNPRGRGVHGAAS